VIALTLARGQLARPTIRAVALAIVLAGTWCAWSPGTAFGLSGVLGGWQFAGPHLLDIGLVLLAVAGALTGAASREGGLDEQLHAAGVGRWATLGATVAAGAWVAVALAVGFAAGTAAGGLLRSVTRGGSSWIDPDRPSTSPPRCSPSGASAWTAALVGALAALVGWVARRDDLGCGVVVVLALPALEQASALLGRVPSVIDGFVFTPWGALRAVALADRGLAAAGWGRPTGVVLPAAVLMGWVAVLVALALPPSAGRVGSTAVGVGPASDADRRAPSSVPPTGWSRRRPTGRRVRVVAAATAVVVVALTLVVGATVPTRLARTLPWRWQRTWREATHQGWSSTQTVDDVVAAVRADADVADRVAGSDAVGPAVIESLRRADRVDRQPESSMRAPDQVTVRLHFDDAVVSGRAAFSDYLVRFSLEADELGHWHIVRSEGPVASVAVELGPGAAG
jgi:hypothetical protein